MEAYKRWVRWNREYVHSLESLANGLTWFLPERFSESEIGPEAVTSVFGIITSINDHIIDTTPTRVRGEHVEPSSFPYSLFITLLKDLETLVEVAAQQYYGDDKKWNFIAFVEAIKVFVRLAVFRSSGYKMLLQGGETINIDKNSDAHNSPSRGQRVNPEWHNGPSNLGNSYGPNAWKLEGRALSALSRFGQNARMVTEPTWLRGVQQQHTIVKPPAMQTERPSVVTILSQKGISGGLFLVGEVMFIVRPLVYVLLIRKYGSKSWFPWFLSVLVDLTGNGILSCVTMTGQSTKKPKLHLSDDEKNELKRRRLLWALYLMRDPFFTKYTRQRLEGAQRVLEPVPIIGFIAEKLIELIVGAQTRYTYMSGS